MTAAPTEQNETSPRTRRIRIAARISAWIAGLTGAAVLCGLLVLSLALALAWPNLPSIETLTDYRPKVPMRVFTADGYLIGEFGEERRNVVRIDEFPAHMKQAILAAEDDRFYQHSGIDVSGILRAMFANVAAGGTKQGASTITQQVARNFFLTSDRSGWRAYVRKVYEILLAFKIEANLSKDQILEIYMNQIFLGQRAFGFGQAAQAYYGKNVKDLTIGEAAMLAGLPKAPSTFNPVVNPKRAAIRQKYVLGRMRQLGYITEEQYTAAVAEPIRVRSTPNTYATHADDVAEMARMAAHDIWGDDAYTHGLNVYTTILKADQDAAYAAVRRGVIDYDRRHGYRGPEGFVDMPAAMTEDWADDALEKYPEVEDMTAAVVIEASPKLVKVLLGGEVVTIPESGLKFVASALAPNAQPRRKIRPGAIVRIAPLGEGLEITQVPEVETAFVSMNSRDGAVRALVGGFDFNRNKFNHVTQAWRQPGSGFKPFVYSAALEKGFSPTTVINDEPLTVDAALTGGQPWEPKNYDGTYEGPMSMRTALTKSKNLVSVRIIQAITPKYAQDYITRFGFDADKHPPYLTMALGAGSVTPWQMATGYAVFANGGYRVNPYIVAKITDANGRVLAQASPVQAGDEANRVIDARNAFIMDSMMRDVARFGTAARASSLKRTDIAGKTGTTNDAIDAWFNGYQPSLVAIAWIGFDQPKSLGDRETGGAAALPIWINYMAKVLPQVPVVDRSVPAGVVAINGDYYYTENQPGEATGSLGLTDGAPDQQKKQEAIKNELF